jgi:hypothetical protein
MIILPIGDLSEFRECLFRKEHPTVMRQLQRQNAPSQKVDPPFASEIYVPAIFATTWEESRIRAAALLRRPPQSPI